MRTTPPARPDAAPVSATHGSGADGGFTLVEVIVALSLLAMLSTAALYFFVSGTRTVTHQQRSHGAVSAANDAMEQAFSYVPQMAGSTAATMSSGLLVGRLDTDVTAAWTAAAGVPGVADTYPGWDRATSPAPMPGVADDRIKLQRTVRTSGIYYEVQTLIGYCYRVSTNPDGACTRVGGDSVGTPSPGYVRMMRVIVVVRWDGTTQSCSGGTCTYQVQSLVDPNTDIKWNNTTRLQAADDAVVVNAGESVMIDVLSNDALPEIPTGSPNPVTLVTTPARGGTAVGTASVRAGGKIEYTAPVDSYGEVTFVYRVSLGARNVQATVHAYITPRARDLNATVMVNGTVEIPVPTADGAAAAELTIVTPPSSGTLTVLSGPKRFRYQAGPAAGSREFTYTYRDAAGLESLAGTGRITVSTYAPGTAPALVYPRSGTWPAQASVAPRTLDLRGDSNNPTGYRTVLVSPPTGGTITNATVGTPVAGALTWNQPANAAGAYTFSYRIVAPDGSNPSPDGTVTVLVPPVAQDRTITIKRSTSSATTGTVTFASIPGSGVTYTRTSQPSCASATSPSSSATQVLQVQRNASATSCTFQYTATVNTSAGPLTSVPATVTVVVTR